MTRRTLLADGAYTPSEMRPLKLLGAQGQPPAAEAKTRGSLPDEALPVSSPFVTVRETASLLRVPLSWVYERTRQPDGIPCYRAGKALVFDREEVLRWFRETCRHRLLPGDRRRRKRAPNTRPEGLRAKKAAPTRLSANGPTAVAIRLPEDARK